MPIPPRYLQAIQHTLPDVPPTTMRLIQEGMVNDIVVVGDEWVFRFPKHDWAKEMQLHEARVLDFIRDRVAVPLPRFETLGEDVASYRLLPGVPLSRTALLSQPADTRSALLGEVVGFVRDMHSVPVEEAKAAGIGPSDTNRERSWWLTFHRELEEHVVPLLMRHQRDYIAELFAPVLSGALGFEYEPCLVHGDLAAYHLLFDPTGGRLTGVLDFGTAGLGDPAVDIATLIRVFGESVVMPHLAGYALDRPLLDRARFWAASIELQSALAGVRRGSTELLVAHIGSTAHDLLA